MIKKLRRLLSLRDNFSPVPKLINTKSYGLIAEHNGGWVNVLARTEFVMPRLFYWFAYRNIQAGDLVWVKLTSRYKNQKSANLELFIKYVLPRIDKPFHLITTDGDTTVPDELPPRVVKKLSDNQFLVNWFSQNCTKAGKSKFKPIPIGFDFHTNRCGLIGNSLQSALVDLAQLGSVEIDRKQQIFCDVFINKTSETRAELYKSIKHSSLYKVPSTPLNQLDLWHEYAHHAFVLSLEGNGLDCHRTWEALYLGCTVLVLSSEIDHIYQGLNVYILLDRQELQDKGLYQRLMEFRYSFANDAYQNDFLQMKGHCR